MPTAATTARAAPTMMPVRRPGPAGPPTRVVARPPRPRYSGWASPGPFVDMQLPLSGWREQPNVARARGGGELQVSVRPRLVRRLVRREPAPQDQQSPDQDRDRPGEVGGVRFHVQLVR